MRILHISQEMLIDSITKEVHVIARKKINLCGGVSKPLKTSSHANLRYPGLGMNTNKCVVRTVYTNIVSGIDDK